MASPSPRVRIVHLSEAVHAALADGDLDGANELAPVPLPPAFAAEDWRWLWALRRDQVRSDPVAAGWVTGAIWAADEAVVVGRAGFHGPPDAAGMVELGYEVLPAHRRRGHARAALAAMLRRAAVETQVQTVRVTISPDNAASHAVIGPFGFVRVGEQWDEQDGLEIVYEVDAQGA